MGHSYKSFSGCFFSIVYEQSCRPPSSTAPRRVRAWPPLPFIIPISASYLPCQRLLSFNNMGNCWSVRLLAMNILNLHQPGSLQNPGEEIKSLTALFCANINVSFERKKGKMSFTFPPFVNVPAQMQINACMCSTMMMRMMRMRALQPLMTTYPLPLPSLIMNAIWNVCMCVCVRVCTCTRARPWTAIRGCSPWKMCLTTHRTLWLASPYPALNNEI